MRIAVPDLVSSSYFPALAAVELGYLRAEGVQAELVVSFPVTRSMERLRDGELEFVAGSAHAPLFAFPNWQGAKLLAALAQRMYWKLVVRRDLPIERGDLGALRGLRLSAAPGPDQGLRRLLREFGLDPDRDLRIAPLADSRDSGDSFGVAAAHALEAGEIDGFWANAMGSEVAVRRGSGRIVHDLRAGDGPISARNYTFPALMTTERTIERDPELVAAVTRAIVAVQRLLRDEPDRATEVGRRLFPPTEAGYLADLIRRDAPFYDPVIAPDVVAEMNGFARDIGWLTADVPYGAVVATRFAALWSS